MKIVISGMFAALLAVGLAGCGGGKTVVQTSPQSCGKQLMDLKEALDNGAMNQKEYDRARKKAMRNCK